MFCLRVHIRFRVRLHLRIRVRVVETTFASLARHVWFHVCFVVELRVTRTMQQAADRQADESASQPFLFFS